MRKVFRSNEHLAWFVICVVEFVLATSTCFCGLARGGTVMLPLASGHAWVSYRAAVVTKFGKVNGDGYSVDCIWFNALLSFTYVLLYFWLGE